MLKITLQVKGMMCAHCEAHMTKTIQAKFPSAQVTASSAKNQVVILTGQDIAEPLLQDLVKQAGYEFISAQKEEAKKKGLFSIFNK